MNLIKIIGVACFNAFVGLLFSTFTVQICFLAL